MIHPSDQEVELFQLINWTLTHPLIDPLMIAVSSVVPWVVALGYLVFVTFFKRSLSRKTFLFILGLLGVADSVTHYFIKPLLGRPRPCKVLEVVRTIDGCGGFYGLPSNHATNSFLLAGLVFIFFSKKLGISFMLCSLLISYSRIYLGRHYPSDILAGFLLAFLILLSVFFIEKIMFRKNLAS